MNIESRPKTRYQPDFDSVDTQKMSLLVNPAGQGNTIYNGGHEVDHIKQRRNAMEYAKFLVESSQFLGVWWRIPAPLAILLLLLSPFNDACFGGRKENDPIRQTGHECGGQRKQCTPSIGRVEKA